MLKRMDDIDKRILDKKQLQEEENLKKIVESRIKQIEKQSNILRLMRQKEYQNLKRQEELEEKEKKQEGKINIIKTTNVNEIR